MADLHPAIVLFFLSGLLVFWLTPLSAWWMLSDQPNRSATIWFLGTAFYALVATLFVFGNGLPGWFRGPFANLIGLASLICMVEALRREISSRPTPYLAYGIGILIHQATVNTTFVIGLYAPIGLACHLLILSIVEIGLIAIIERVRRQTKGRALLLVTFVLALFAFSNLARVIELLTTGQLPMLLDFSLISNASLILNYVSVVFYCYGYWGFIVEKNNTLVQQATAEAVESRSKELIAIQQKELTRSELTLRSEMIQRVAAIGKIAQSAALTGSIAHEINQPLTAIILNLSETRNQVENKTSGEKTLERLIRVEEDALRIATIIKRIKSIFEQKDPPVSNQTIDQVIQSTLNLLKDNLEKNEIEISILLDDTRPFVFSADEIEHVFLNILQNAIEALHTHAKPRKIEIVSWTDDDHVFASINDNGPGVPIAMKQKIFELNETGKENGSGLGLWLARYIVERNGGKISLDENSSEGARFIIQLPLKSVRDTES